MPATIGAVTVVSLVQVLLELLWLGEKSVKAGTPVLLWAHLIAAGVAIALFGTVRALRSGQTQFLGYSERYLVGLGYGIATSLLMSITAGMLAATSAGNAVELAGTFMTLSLLSMQLPIACVIGGLTWHLLTKVRGGTPIPARPRRPIEDPE